MSKLCRPFLKWAGNKYGLLPHIVPELHGGNRYIEPFAGSAVVFLNTSYKQCFIWDKNPHLISLYQQLVAHQERLIEDARRLFVRQCNTSSFYYRARAEFNDCTDVHRRSLLFLYLNRHCYNGLCRFNASGQFNVPFGTNAKPYFPEAEMRHFVERSHHTTFRYGDFEEALNLAMPGDVVYCDPPYLPLSTTAKFTDYAVGGFSLRDHEKLADHARILANKDVRVLISNHDLPSIRNLYKGARLKSFDATRRISRNATDRKAVRELLAIF